MREPDAGRWGAVLVMAAAGAIAAGCSTKGPGADSRDGHRDTTAEARAALEAPRTDSVHNALAGTMPGPVANAIPTGADNGAKPGEWTMPGRDYVNSRFSPLGDINTSNVAQLKVASSMATGVLNGMEGQPLVVGSTMYVVTPFPNVLTAIDLTKPGGVAKWSYEPNPDPRSVGIACCDIVNRGAVFADGKIIYNLLDAETVAVDANTGKPAWRTRVGDINLGETFTAAPLVVGNNVFVGNAGGELGVRGYIAALDLKSGAV
jgi:glucose dehydrogenase